MATQLSLIEASPSEPEWLQFLPQHVPSTTFAELVERYIERLRAEGKPWEDVDRAYRRHLVPAFGRFKIAELEARHFVTWAKWALARGRAGHPLKRATVQKLLSFAAQPLNDAVLAKAIPYNPAHLPRNALGKHDVVDEVELARQVPGVPTIERLLYDPRLPFRRRLFWGLILLTGARFGEAAALTWDHYIRRDPLNEVKLELAWNSRKLQLEPCTKTGVPKHVAAHPALADLLEEARVTWWPATFGRHPAPEDLVAPAERRRAPAIRSQSTTYREWLSDLALVGAEAVGKLHNSRAAFITRLTEAGAPRAVVKRMTHPRRRGSASSYERYEYADWIPRCKAVLCLHLERRSPQLDLFAPRNPQPPPRGEE